MRGVPDKPSQSFACDTTRGGQHCSAVAVASALVVALCFPSSAEVP